MVANSQRPFTEETLDLEDWKKLRELGHQMVDDMMVFLQNIGSQPTLALTEEVIDDICVPLSEEGEEFVY